jgi:hypothetical protein
MKRPAVVILAALVLIGCGGYDPQAEEQEGTQGVQVTATVPFSNAIGYADNLAPLPDRVIIQGKTP